MYTYPDNTISVVCIHRCSSACFAMVAVTGLMTTDTLYFHFTLSFCVSFWGSGVIFQAARTSLHLKENHYSIDTFKEKSFALYIQFITLNFGSDYISHCTQQTNPEICCINETLMSSWCQKLTMLPEGYVLYKDKMVFHLTFKSSAMMEKYLKVNTERFSVHSLYLVFINCL